MNTYSPVIITMPITLTVIRLIQVTIWLPILTVGSTLIQIAHAISLSIYMCIYVYIYIYIHIGRSPK